MGFFDAIKAAGSAMKDEYNKNREAAELEKARQAEMTNVAEIVFEKFGEDKISVAESVKTDIFNRGDKKKIIESLRDGRAGFVKVTVEDEKAYFESTGENTHEYKYGSLKTLDGIAIQGRFIEEYGHVFYNMSWYDDDEMLEDGTYVDNTAKKPKKKGVLVRFYIGKKERYILLEEKGFKSMEFLKDDAYRSYIDSVMY